MEVWQSYLENKISGVIRMCRAYSPNQRDITIIGLELHTEDKKNGAYFAEALFCQGEIPVKFQKEMLKQGLPYCVVFCKVLKRDADKFEEG